MSSLRQRRFMGVPFSSLIAKAGAGTTGTAGAGVAAASGASPEYLEPPSKIPPHHTLTSLSITHVQFRQDDIFSKLLAYVTLSPLAIICGYVAVIITSRDLKPLVMFAGQLANEVVNQILKRLVKQARPTEYLGDGYGMPSSHSQFMAYFSTYVAILMYRRGVAPGAVIPHIVSGLVIFWSGMVIYSRVHLFYHTWQQVVAGTICGCLFAVGYYYITNRILRPMGLFAWVVNHPWARSLYIRDTDMVDDLAQFDWEMWQQALKNKQEKRE
ncbi:Dolichyldiphosphatase 1 [Mortierella polycephala]|uniref:Dolichyldiphosphatase n=1 Tax=Mortierella polycephala TaxID=41804 RepID=A0A9P6Q3J2_9FUNG|nr:Dolichyldiphosphatase 1 [Mortierella polycephala]